MMETSQEENYLEEIADLKNRLEEAEQLIEAIKAGEVDAFAVRKDNESEVYTLQSGDYAYRILVENFREGAINVTEDGLIVYTNRYFHEMLGLRYEDVVGKVFYDFIHFESKKSFNSLFATALDGQSKGEINLLVGNRIIPVYISLTSLYPKLPSVGIIVTDLTEKKANERAMEEKNKELERSNVELASFSYAASHDLQEPLRKIQTFISRILQLDNGNFSSAGKDYFLRITKAAVRMQDLIDSLLNYSRITNADKMLVPTDLNEMVNQTRENLQELIEDNDAVIEAITLPTVKVIPQQFQQLLANIISNAIKYKKENVKPVIIIRAAKVPLTEVETDLPTYAQSYWKISITDNGIGFDPQYSERIFELFQRLHGRDEYEGTGIGLAICKKIVENHNGIITTQSELGKGSTFNIYLPEDRS
jgi:PAS domain S-box-containing protein